MKPNPLKTTAVLVRLSPELKHKLAQVAEHYEQSASARLRELLRKDIDAFERKHGRIPPPPED